MSQCGEQLVEGVCEESVERGGCRRSVCESVERGSCPWCWMLGDNNNNSSSSSRNVAAPPPLLLMPHLHRAAETSGFYLPGWMTASLKSTKQTVSRTP